MIDLIRKQRELKNSLVPKGLQNAFDLQKKFQPLNVLQNTAFQESPAWKLKKSLDIAMHSKNTELTTSAMMLAAAGIGRNSLFTENSILSIIAKSYAASGAIAKGFHSSSALHTAIGMQNKLNLNFASDFLKASHLSNLSALATSTLRHPNTSLLSQSFEFARYASQSFILPDFSKIKFDDEAEGEKKIIIQISPTDIPTIIKELYADNARLNIINPRKFEEVIAELLRYHGYEVSLTKQTRDGGFDMTLQKTLEDGRPFKAIVECKRFKKKIDVNIIRCFSAVAYKEGVRDGIIVTTSTFTRDAEKECKFMPADLSLKDRSDVLSWAGSYLGKMPFINLDFQKRGLKA